jgi:hypothetical protein
MTMSDPSSQGLNEDLRKRIRQLIEIYEKHRRRLEKKQKVRSDPD